jgi:nicotinamide-nucleotide amidase
MNVEIVSIGTEILLGEIVDTNSNHIARTLRDIGANLYYVTVVGDNLERITQALRTGLNRSNLVITTGGLGPTVDDVTRQAVATATERELEFQQGLLDQIATRFAAFGVRMSENNRQQAYVPAEAIVLENKLGTAPCFVVEHGESAIASLPGVPREMKHILAQQVVPYIQQKMGTSRIIKALVLRTAGIGESHLDEHIADLMTNANPTVGLAAHTGQTDIRITALAETELEADTLIADMEAIVRERVGAYIYGTDHDPLEAALVDTLRTQQRTLATYEHGTQGQLQHRLQQAPNYEDFYTHASILPGAAPEQVIAELSDIARGHRESARADIGIAIATRPGNTAIVVTTAQKTVQRNYDFGGEASQAADWTPTWGMSMAWRLLREMELHPDA